MEASGVAGLIRAANGFRSAAASKALRVAAVMTILLAFSAVPSDPDCPVGGALHDACAEDAGAVSGDAAGPASRIKGKIVFLVDCSGSMRIRDQADPSDGVRQPVSRLEAAVSEVKLTLEGLAERGDYEFDIVLFKSAASILSRDRIGKAGLLPLSPDTLKAAAGFLAEANSSGTTLLAEAINEALKLFGPGQEPGVMNTVFIYTDGVPTFPREDEAAVPAPTSEFLREFRIAVKEKNVCAAKINTFAIGATSVSREFLMVLALDNGGISIIGKGID